MTSKSYELALECKRQFENCLYSAATITLWLKFLRGAHAVLVALSLSCGAFAGWSIVKQSASGPIQLFGAAAALLAGLVPTILAALKVPQQIERSQMLHGEFTSLRDRFRQAALVHSKKPFADFEAIFASLMDRVDAARREGVTPPEPFFRIARAKILKGHYTFDIDLPPNNGDGSEKG